MIDTETEPTFFIYEAADGADCQDGSDASMLPPQSAVQQGLQAPAPAMLGFVPLQESPQKCVGQETLDDA